MRYGNLFSVFLNGPIGGIVKIFSIHSRYIFHGRTNNFNSILCGLDIGVNKQAKKDMTKKIGNIRGKINILWVKKTRK